MSLGILRSADARARNRSEIMPRSSFRRPKADILTVNCHTHVFTFAASRRFVVMMWAGMHFHGDVRQPFDTVQPFLVDRGRLRAV